MNERQMKLKADAIVWHRFTRKSYAIFESLGKEISTGVLSVATLLFATAGSATAQTTTQHTSSYDREMETDDVEVTASRVPLTMEQTARIVSMMTHEEIKQCPAQSVNDLLKFAAGVDVRQRGAFGVQTDISINGGTHDQIVILLNGVNISSPHTGHLAADFPVNIDDIERIEILEGAASRVYGTSAFSGAINIVTRKGNDRSATIGAEAGSFGSVGGNATVSLGSKNMSNTLSGGYMRSDGGTENSDFSRWRGFYQGGTSTDIADFNWQLGVSGQNYGANTFYSGAYPDQYEENRRYMASVSARTKGRIVFTPTLYANRSMDHYQLVRGVSPWQENYHMTDVYGASVNAQTTWALGITSVGADFRNEGILSTSLGRPLEEKMYIDVPGSERKYTKRDNRTNVCYYLEHDVVLDRWTVSLGLMADMNTGLDYRYRLYPGADVSYRPTSHWRLYASWNMAQRMPTFTDLYYKSPTQEGNTGLKPEKTSEFTLGGRFRSRGVCAELRAFHRHQTSMIDWIIPMDSVAKYGTSYNTFHAANLKINNVGVNMKASFFAREVFGSGAYLRSVTADYSYINQTRHDQVAIYSSNYGLDYLRHKLVITADTKVFDRLTAQLSYRFQERTGSFIMYDTSITNTNSLGYATHPSLGAVDYHPFGQLDLKLNWEAKHYQLYLQANNLTNYRYYDLGNILQPGFWFMGGVKWKI